MKFKLKTLYHDILCGPQIVRRVSQNKKGQIYLTQRLEDFSLKKHTEVDQEEK